MSALRTVTGLCAFERRGAGTDAERRASSWLAGEAAAPGREVRLEPFWCRPNAALAQAWHVALALAGSVVTVSDPLVGGLVVLAALAALLADATCAVSPGRRLTREHASQNVVSDSVPSPDRGAQLILTAPYDAGRCGAVHRAAPRALAAAARRGLASGRLALGWSAWLALGVGWLLAIAVARRAGASGPPITALQIVPSVALVVALAALLQLAAAPYGPAAGDDGSGVAVALALHRALAVAPPAHLQVSLVLQGAGDAEGLGLRHHLRSRPPGPPIVVLGIAAAGAGTPRWWLSDGPLVPRRAHPRLRELAARTAEALAQPQPTAGHRGRSSTPARAARRGGLPAITLGCLDGRGLAPGSHTGADTLGALDPAALDELLTFALAFVDALDADQSADRPT